MPIIGLETRGGSDEYATVTFLTIPAPVGLKSVEVGTPLVPLFSSSAAAQEMGMDPDRCVRPRLSALIELLGHGQLVVLDAGAQPTLILQLGALAARGA